MFEKLVAIEPVSLIPSAEEELHRYAKEVVLYRDVPASDDEMVRRIGVADAVLLIIESGPYRVRPMTNSKAITSNTLPVCNAPMNNASDTVSASRLRTQAGMRRAPNSLSDARPIMIGPSSPASSNAVGTMAAPTLPTDGICS